MYLEENGRTENYKTVIKGLCWSLESYNHNDNDINDDGDTKGGVACCYTLMACCSVPDSESETISWSVVSSPSPPPPPPLVGGTSSKVRVRERCDTGACFFPWMASDN